MKIIINEKKILRNHKFHKGIELLIDYFNKPHYAGKTQINYNSIGLNGGFIISEAEQLADAIYNGLSRISDYYKTGYSLLSDEEGSGIILKYVLKIRGNPNYFLRDGGCSKHNYSEFKVILPKKSKEIPYYDLLYNQIECMLGNYKETRKKLYESLKKEFE